MAEHVMIWKDGGREANELLRDLMRRARYPWVHRKLNSARLHVIESATRRVEFDGRSPFVTNGDVFEGISGGTR